MMTCLGADLVLACALCMRIAGWIRRVEIVNGGENIDREARIVGISVFIFIYKKDITRETYRLCLKVV